MCLLLNSVIPLYNVHFKITCAEVQLKSIAYKLKPVRIKKITLHFLELTAVPN